MLRSASTPAGVYLRPENTGLLGARGDYVVYAIDEAEVQRAVRRTKSRRSRLAKLDGHVQKQIDITGGPHVGAIPFTHSVVMRAIDPSWPKGDDRLIPALLSGRIQIHYLKPGEVILGPRGVGAMVDPDGKVVSVREKKVGNFGGLVVGS